MPVFPRTPKLHLPFDSDKRSSAWISVSMGRELSPGHTGGQAGTALPQLPRYSFFITRQSNTPPAVLPGWDWKRTVTWLLPLVSSSGIG